MDKQQCLCVCKSASHLLRSPNGGPVPLSLDRPCQLLPEVLRSGASLVRRPQVRSVSARPKLDSSNPPLLRSPKPPPPSPDLAPNLEAPKLPPPPCGADGLLAPQLSLISALEGPSSSRGGRSNSSRSSSKSRPPASPPGQAVPTDQKNNPNTRLLARWRTPEAATPERPASTPIVVDSTLSWTRGQLLCDIRGCLSA